MASISMSSKSASAHKNERNYNSYRHIVSIVITNISQLFPLLLLIVSLSSILIGVVGAPGSKINNRSANVTIHEDPVTTGSPLQLGPNDQCNEVLECNENITSIDCEKKPNPSACYTEILKTVVGCLDDYACRHLQTEHCENEEIVKIAVWRDACRRWGLEYAAEDKKIMEEEKQELEKIYETYRKNTTEAPGNE